MRSYLTNGLTNVRGELVAAKSGQEYRGEHGGRYRREENAMWYDCEAIAQHYTERPRSQAAFRLGCIAGMRALELQPVSTEEMELTGAVLLQLRPAPQNPFERPMVRPAVIKLAEAGIAEVYGVEGLREASLRLCATPEMLGDWMNGMGMIVSAYRGVAELHRNLDEFATPDLLTFERFMAQE
jgi:hypothetical protein